MTERPILFSAPMVRAILGGRKTETRRIIKQPHNNPLGVWEATTVGGPGTYTKNGDPYPECAAIWHTRTGTTIVPPYAVGDRLWVREAFIVGFNLDDATGCPQGEQKVWYRADSPWPQWHDDDSERTLDAPPWKSPIHMPRWASRITLEITDVRAQRLQEISAADCRAEGHPVEWDRSLEPSVHDDAARDWFRDLWTSIHGPGSWEANPWVAAITFERVK